MKLGPKAPRDTTHRWTVSSVAERRLNETSGRGFDPRTVLYAFRVSRRLSAS